MSSETNPLSAYSDHLVKAVSRGGESTVLVDARRRIPASGIVYSADQILTADHVVERDEDISVVLADGTRLAASLAGRDPGSDLALLRLVEARATPAERTTTEGRVGEIVIALGRPSTGGIEASLGIVCAAGGPVRTGRGGLIERYLLTDATPFPGFSGGPLIDTEGRVIGLNTSGFTHGTAITIPAALAWVQAENLAKYGHVKRGYLGIRSQGVALSTEMSQALGRDQVTGLLIVSVEPGSPAQAGGLIVGDILVAMENQPVIDHDALMVTMTGNAVGKPVSIQVMRGGQPQILTVTIGEH
jgi:S1-C subfamily serine protease